MVFPLCLVKVSLTSLCSDHTNTMESEGKRAILQVMVVIMLCDHGYEYDDKKKDQKGRKVIMAIWQIVHNDNDNENDGEEEQKGRRAIWELIRFHSREPLVMR